MVASDSILGEKQYVLSRKVLTPSENLYKRLFIPFLKLQVMKMFQGVGALQQIFRLRLC